MIIGVDQDVGVEECLTAHAALPVSGDDVSEMTPRLASGMIDLSCGPKCAIALANQTAVDVWRTVE